MAVASLQLLHSDNRDAARKAKLFRGTVRSLARDAAQVVCELRFEADADPASEREKLGLVHHYLDYLIRLCDGQV
jgi:hypothetical protein